jgi:hypothetical protein
VRAIVSNTRWLGLLLLVLAGLALSGCASTESENRSEVPWSTPQGWENGMPSGMYNQYR